MSSPKSVSKITRSPAVRTASAMNAAVESRMARNSVTDASKPYEITMKSNRVGSEYGYQTANKPACDAKMMIWLLLLLGDVCSQLLLCPPEYFAPGSNNQHPQASPITVSDYSQTFLFDICLTVGSFYYILLINPYKS